MLQSATFLLLWAVSVRAAKNLWVASQAGDVATLALSDGSNGLKLQRTASTADCGSSPTWLMKDKIQNVLYCLDENLAGGPGHLTSFDINQDGSLSMINTASTGTGPVHSTLYGSNFRGIAVAEYGQGALSTWALGQPAGNFTSQDHVIFPPLASPGPVADRQSQSAAHEAVLDPTGKFILVPDLGADKLHVFSFDENTLKVTEEASTPVPAGSGPRHGAFTTRNDCTRFYLVNELSAKIYAFNVTYPTEGGMVLDMFDEYFTHGDATAAGNAPGELEVTADQRFLTISNRLTGDIPTQNPDPSKTGTIQGDSLSTFQINDDGTLDFLEATSSGGISPRQFATNGDGTMVAVANYASSNVAVFSRDLDTGLIGKTPVASFFFQGSDQSIAAVIWDE